MQHANIYSEFNKRTHKLNKIAGVLREHEHHFHWGPEETVLDAGCGPGDVTARVVSPWLPRDHRLLLGVDVSSSVIDHALQHNASEKVSFEVLDFTGDITEFLQRKEFSEGFNKIFSFYVLQWLPDLKKGVENLFRLLKTGGQIFLMFPVDRLFQKTFMEVRSKDLWIEYSKGGPRKIPQFLTRTSAPNEEFKDMLQDAGFEVVKCEAEKSVSNFECIDDMKDLIESLDHEIDSIPIDLRSKYKQDCFGVLQNMNAIETSDSGLVFTQSMLTAIARKP